ncbi:MAG: hypothetical protein P8L85_11395 [Rubripirellula sp.]|nr:hypothetical protein [Rubripirellula sp.]
MKNFKEVFGEVNPDVISMSDNGWMLGDAGMTIKVLPSTASTRVPLMIVGPGIE